MRPWQEYCDSANWHEAANIFPLMPYDELQKLADDIKANGLKNPIVLLDDKVLDGRNRMLACKLAGVSSDFQSRNAEKLGSPVSWVLSQNLHRRQLTATQRAFVAVEAEKLFAVEAKERQKTLNNAGGKVATSETGKARDKAAKACAVSPRYVQDAKSVAEKSPEVAAQAKAGNVSMAEAKAATQPAKPHAEKRKNRNEPVDDFEEVRAVALRMLNIGLREMRKTEPNHSLLDSAKTWALCRLAERSGSVA